MTAFVFANNASSALAEPLSDVATTLTLNPGDGAKFPNPSADQQFALTLTDAATGLLNEITYCTARSGDVCTVVRAQEDTTALAWLAGDDATSLVTAGQMTAMLQAATLNPTRFVTASGVFVMTTADASGAVGLNRVISPAPSSTTLPAGALAGQTYAIEDLAKNFNAFPVTVNYPGGMAGPGGATYQVLNVDGQCGYFRYYGANQWSFKQ